MHNQKITGNCRLTNQHEKFNIEKKQCSIEVKKNKRKKKREKEEDDEDEND